MESLVNPWDDVKEALGQRIQEIRRSTYLLVEGKLFLSTARSFQLVAGRQTQQCPERLRPPQLSCALSAEKSKHLFAKDLAGLDASVRALECQVAELRARLKEENEILPKVRQFRPLQLALPWHMTLASLKTRSLHV